MKHFILDKYYYYLFINTYKNTKQVKIKIIIYEIIGTYYTYDSLQEYSNLCNEIAS